jgi:hypothetical protein
MSDNVVITLFSGPLFGAPLRHDRRKVLIDGDVGNGGLCAEEGSAAREMSV